MLTKAEEQDLAVRDALLDRKILHGCSGKYCSKCEGDFLMPDEIRQAKHCCILDELSVVQDRIITLRKFVNKVEGSEEPAEPVENKQIESMALSDVLDNLPTNLATISKEILTQVERLEKLLF